MFHPAFRIFRTSCTLNIWYMNRLGLGFYQFFTRCAAVDGAFLSYPHSGYAIRQICKSNGKYRNVCACIHPLAAIKIVYMKINLLWQHNKWKHCAFIQLTGNGAKEKSRKKAQNNTDSDGNNVAHEMNLYNKEELHHWSSDMVQSPPSSASPSLSLAHDFCNFGSSIKADTHVRNA